MKARAVLDWHLWTKCPYCGHDFDLSDHDEEGQWSKPLFSNKWDNIKGAEVECPRCSEVSEIEEVEY